MPEVWRAPKGFVVSVLALAMPGVVCGGPACQDPRVGQRDSRREGSGGWAPGGRPVCTRPPGVTAEWLEDGEKGPGSGCDKGRLLPHSGKGDYCFEEKGRPRCGAEASPRRDWWVGGELSPGLGSGVDSPRPGPPGRSERAIGERALGAPLSCRESPGREPPAQVLWGSGCAQPGEERKTTGGEGGSGRKGCSEGRGGRPALVLARTLGDPERGARRGPPGPLGQGRAHSPCPGRSSAPQPSPTTLPHGPGPGKGSSNPWRRLRAFSLVPVAPPATRGRVGGPAQHPLPAPINPFCPVSGLGPALSPSLQASAPSPGC